jgi:hypothetical protein
VARHEYEMALTRADFLRLLPVAVQGEFAVSEDVINGESAGVTWSITVLELEPRRIALLSLPRLNVQLVLRAASTAAADEWLRRFLLGYQRAGG